MTDQEFVYCRVGMALTSAQRVEYITRELLIYLAEFDRDFYGFTTDEFLSATPALVKLRKQTLGQVFRLLKLNPHLIMEEELNVYLNKRNLLVHNFWEQYLNSYSQEQVSRAIDFCNEFGKSSQRIESYFKGFIYMLALRFIKDRNHMHDNFKDWENDFDFFMDSLPKNKDIE